MSLTLTLVRHGESTDNLKSLWAGHRDAPLTTHGMNQARRLGKSLQDVYITKIYASDLKRAHWTALQIATQNKSLLARLEELEEEHDVSDIAQAPIDTSSSPMVSLKNGHLAGVNDSESREDSPLMTPLRSKSWQSHYTEQDDPGVHSTPMPFAPSSSSSPASVNGKTADTSVDSKAVAEQTAGPSSIVGTDRIKAGHTRAPSSPSSDITPSDAHEDLYNDDFTLSSSAAASSPVSAIRFGNGYPSSALDAAAASLASTVTTTPLLREQYFGLAEGQSWRSGYATSANAHHNRGYKFEAGESLEDVHARAREVLKRCVVPWIVTAAQHRGPRGAEGEHVVLVAHGIMISELLFALSRLQDPKAPYTRQSGHTNTGWTRFTLSLPVGFDAEELPHVVFPSLTSPELPAPYSTAAASSTSASSLPIDSFPRVTLRQSHANHIEHLKGLRRTKGGIASEGYDARQKSLKEFFSGGGTTSATEDSPDTAETAKDEGNGWKVKLGNGNGNGKTPMIDLTDEDGNTQKEDATHRKNRARVLTPPSPSPKKGRLT